MDTKISKQCPVPATTWAVFSRETVKQNGSSHEHLTIGVDEGSFRILSKRNGIIPFELTKVKLQLGRKRNHEAMDPTESEEERLLGDETADEKEKTQDGKKVKFSAQSRLTLALQSTSEAKKQEELTPATNQEESETQKANPTPEPKGMEEAEPISQNSPVPGPSKPANVQAPSKDKKKTTTKGKA